MSLSTDIDAKKLQRAFWLIGRHAIPQATADALNAAADAVKNESVKNVRSRLTVRTPFTTRSLVQDRHARPAALHRMFARVGSRSPYLPAHDTGETRKALRTAIPIPTLYARKDTKQNKIQPKHAMNRIGDVRRQKRFFLGTPKGGNRPAGIWERTNNNKKIRLVRLTTASEVKIPATYWFTDAVKKYGTPQYIRAKWQQKADQLLHGQEVK